MTSDNTEEFLLRILLNHYMGSQPALMATIQQGLSAGLTPAQIEAAVAWHCPAGSGVPLHVRLLADHLQRQRTKAISQYADKYPN